MSGPDGVGLPEEARQIIADAVFPQMVHLRLRPNPTDYPVTGCGAGIGEWWTGKASEVTCPDCLEVVHA